MGSVIDADKVIFFERFAYRLEHFSAISHIGGIDVNLPRVYFATGDKLGCVKIWDLDGKESLFAL